MVNRRGLEVEIVTLLALRYVTVKGDDGPLLQGICLLFQELVRDH